MPPPLYVKGGVWTNVEDEILKAAVQKYGLYQWERISSLLPKKSAKQVKARWVEYLSPIINKTDWTPEEDEKLLNLHKIFPNQWRSISNALNRTAVQCVERYQKLIDEVSGYQPKDNEENLGLSGPGIETLPAAGASSIPITAGEINFNPESKPAMPDDEDLPDDEREMLAEAKARLGNIQGKKAKRKARERMLEESKRIALLQKRRELKAAGINIKLATKNKKKRKEFDYNADIYQEIEPTEGPYDVSEETRQNELEQNKFKKEVSAKGISMKDIDDRIAKEESKRRKEREKKLAKNKRVIEADEELVDNKRRKLEAPIPEPRKVPNKNRSAIARLVKSMFEKLPTPKHDKGKVLPLFASDVTKDLAASGDYEDAEDEAPRVDESLKALASQAVQRDLPIPNPNNLRDLDSLSFDSSLERSVAEECYKLIKSDYRKYQDDSFDAPFVKELDPELHEKINKEVEIELAKLDTSISQPLGVYELPKSFEVAESIIDTLHTLHKRNEALSSQLVGSNDFEQQRDAKLQTLRSLVTGLREVDLELATEKKVTDIENAAIDRETEKINKKLAELDKRMKLLQRTTV
ncbi:Pre-mRNA-splicing factor CEF1 [Candida viswanathii]|uniref:Pre-mRNA-splicing factor CEF1 n=1 Tax=Candida viswanathii TaxID=5486 RepID=A0A367YD74_9ASCO|nr:Pre-mRNA-splicing factor CEF1 [Candida viswanathii]